MSKRKPDAIFNLMAVEGLASPEYAALCRKLGYEPWGPPATREDVRKAKEAYYASLAPVPLQERPSIDLSHTQG